MASSSPFPLSEIISHGQTLEVRKTCDVETLVASISDGFGIDMFFWDSESVRIVTIGLSGGKITIYDLTTGDSFVVKGTKMQAKCHAFSRSKGLLACLIFDKDSRETLSLISVAQAQTLTSFKTETKSAEKVVFGAEDNWLIIYERYFSSKIYVHTFDGTPMYRLQCDGIFSIVKMTPGHSTLLTVVNSNELVFYHGKCYQKIATKDLKTLFKESSAFNFYEEFSLKQELGSGDIFRKKRGDVTRFQVQQVRR
jgi:hypothetical protein